MANDPARKPNLVRPADHAAATDARWEFTHPFNPASQVSAVDLGAITGLQRTGVNLLRVPAGKESFVYHAHTNEEEWLYILSGRGVAEIDGAEHEVGPGDFMAFPTPSVGHHLRNPGPDDLVYLSGGERRDVEVVDFPRVGKRIVRVGAALAVHALDEAAPLGERPKLEPPR